MSDKQDDLIQEPVHHQCPDTHELTGGATNGKGFSIYWEDTRKEGFKGGAKVEDVLLATIHRLRLIQWGKSQRSRNNDLALKSIEDAYFRLTSGDVFQYVKVDGE